jgi:hypothetical protein
MNVSNVPNKKAKKTPLYTYPDLSFANSKVQKLLLKEKERKKGMLVTFLQ